MTSHLIREHLREERICLGDRGQKVLNLEEEAEVFRRSE